MEEIHVLNEHQAPLSTQSARRRFLEERHCTHCCSDSGEEAVKDSRRHKRLESGSGAAPG